MQGLTKKSREVLELWRKEYSIGEMAILLNLKYNVVRNNYFKHFKRNNYLNRVSRGRYIINEKGNQKLKNDLEYLKIGSIILKLSKKRFSNNSIKKSLCNRLNYDITDSALFSKIYRLRKKYNIEKRNTKYINLNKIKINYSFFEFLGLVLSDGYIHKYQIEFTNKDKAILDRYKKIVSRCGLDVREKLIQLEATKIIVYSLNFVNIVNKFLGNKKKLSEKLTKNKKSLQNAFLRGLYSGDGCAGISISYRKSKNKWRIEPFISLSARNSNIRNPVFLMLQNMDYKPNANNKDIRLTKEEDIKRFNECIRFVIGSKIRKSKYWNGMEKNRILSYIANDIKNDCRLKELTTQINKNKIINHIRRKLTDV